MKVAVLGGGIAGVLTARTLLARGYDVQVLEAADRVGGLCRSEVVDGFVYDVAGGHVLHSRDAGVLRDMVSALDDPVKTKRNTKIYTQGRYVKYPFENGLADLPSQVNFECLRGYIDAHFVRERGAIEPEDFRSWIQWRFGAGIAEHFMLPYNEKIWCSDLTDVSSAWCSGRVPEAPLDDVIRASLGLESEGYTHQLEFYYPRSGGFESLVTAFAEGLRACVKTSTPVVDVKPAGDGFEVNGERFDRVVNTLPLKRLFPALATDVPTSVSDALDGLRHLSLSTVLVAVDQADLAPYSWVYLPQPDDGPMNRVTFLANYSPRNAPAGASSVLAEITSPGGSGSPDLAALERTVVEDLARASMLEQRKVRFVRSFFNEYAYPVHDHGFPERIAIVLDWLAKQSIPSVGRFARYSYVNTDQVYAMVQATLADDFAPL